MAALYDDGLTVRARYEAAVRPRAWRRDGQFVAHRVARHAEGSDRRDPQPRDRLHDAVLRDLVRAGVRLRAGEGGAPVVDAAAGILWIAIAFSGTLALGRTFERERYTDTLRALMLAPADRARDLRRQAAGDRRADRRSRGAAGAARGVAVPGGAVRRAAAARRDSARSGTLGFAAVGTLFAAMLVRARSRDVLLPVLLYPITIPVIIARRSRHRGAARAPRRTSRWRSSGSGCCVVLRRRLRRAVALDVRAADDGVEGRECARRVRRGRREQA